MVQDAQGVAGKLGNPATDTLCTRRADVPGSCALWVIAHSEEESTERRVLGLYPVLSNSRPVDPPGIRGSSTAGPAVGSRVGCQTATGSRSGGVVGVD